MRIGDFFFNLFGGIKRIIYICKTIKNKIEMEKQLKTMEQKMAENPNEIMENGLTRAQNDKINSDGDLFAGVIRLAVGVFILFSLIKIVL